MRASGQDKRGQGSARATIVSVMRAEGAGTVVDRTDFTITGRLARFGRSGMIKDVSNHLLRDFSSCLTQTIEAEGADVGPAPAGATDASGSVAPDEPGPSGAAKDASAEAGAGPAGSISAQGPVTAPAPGPRPAPAPAKPVRGISLLLSVLAERIRRLLGRG